MTTLRGSAKYPVALDLHGRGVVVCGGGAPAEAVVRRLLAAGAQPTVIAVSIDAGVQALLAGGAGRIVERPFEPNDVSGAALAFAASGDAAADAAVVAAARARNVLVENVSDGGGDFTSALVHRAGSLTFTVDAGELNPSLGARLLDELRQHFDARYARAAETLRRVAGYALATLGPALGAAVLRSLAGRPLDELARLDPGRAQDEADALAQQLAKPEALGASAGFVSAVCATRASSLAMWQTRHVMALLAEAGVVSTVLQISTKGDLIQDRSLAALGTDSIFVKELELALREERADYAVHSCKDLPSSLAGDMELAAIGAREDARDAFCSEIYPSFDDLPAGAVIGTSSPRRRAQLGALRPDLRYESIRGNVDTRLRKLREGQFDAIVLASAGLRRLGLGAKHVEPFDPSVVVPAVAQGALAVETRAGDPLAARIRAAFNDAASERCVRAERAFLRALRGGCQAPVGAYATLSGDALRLRAVIAAADGSSVVRRDETYEVHDAVEAEACGSELAYEMLTAGGAELLAAVDLPQPLAGTLVLLPHAPATGRIAPALRGAGAEVIEAGGSDDAELALGGRAPHVLLFASSASVRAVAAYLERLRARAAKPVVAAMGEASSAAARAAGFPPDVVAPEASIAAFVQNVTHHLIGRNGS